MTHLGEGEGSRASPERERREGGGRIALWTVAKELGHKNVCEWKTRMAIPAIIAREVRSWSIGSSWNVSLGQTSFCLRPPARSRMLNAV